MGLRLNTNIAAINTHRVLGLTDRTLARSFDRLASGLRINRASDDAAGLSISESLRSQVRGGQQAARNIQDALSALNVADGALQEVTAMVQRMRELAVQAANGGYSSEQRAALQAEFASLRDEIRNLAINTTFNGFPLLAGAGDNYVTSPLRSSTALWSPTSESLNVGSRQALFAAVPKTATSNSFAITERRDTFAVDGTTSAVTLSRRPEVYGLGTPGAESIVVTMRDTTSGTTRTIAYGGPNGYSYDAATNRIVLNGTAVPAGPEDQLHVDYIPQGSLNFTLSSPLAGTETVQVGGAPIANDPTNGYSLSGNTLRLNGSARPGVGSGATVSVGYQSGTSAVTLPARAEQYGLGAAGPQSIVVTLRNTGTGAARTIAYGAANGFTYDAATGRVLLNGTAIPSGGENQIQVDFIQQGSLTRPLGGQPFAGTETLQLNGAPLANDPANGYSLSGNRLTLNGNARPSAGVTSTLSVSYLAQGSTRIALDSSNPYFGGALLNAGSITISVDGVPQTFSEGVDYTIEAGQSDWAGLTPLYAYALVFDNATLLAAASSSSPTVQVGYTMDYPTNYGPMGLDIQVGANEGQIHTIGLDRINADALGIRTTNLSTQLGAMAALDDLDFALVRLARIRSRYGADQNRLGAALNSVDQGVEQMASAESRIRDADMADEMSSLTRQQILLQSGLAMLQQANVESSRVLGLLNA